MRIQRVHIVPARSGYTGCVGFLWIQRAGANFSMGSKIGQCWPIDQGITIMTDDLGQYLIGYFRHGGLQSGQRSGQFYFSRRHQTRHVHSKNSTGWQFGFQPETWAALMMTESFHWRGMWRAMCTPPVGSDTVADFDPVPEPPHSPAFRKTGLVQNSDNNGNLV